MITAHTRNAFLITEVLDPNKQDQLEEALDFIEGHCKLQLQAETSQYILSKENSCLTLKA